MAAAQTALAAYTKLCTGNNGGGNKLYFMLPENLTSMTLGTGVQSYDTITLPTGKFFYEFLFEEYTIGLTPVLEGAKGAQKWTNTLMFDLGGLSDTERTGIMSLIDNSACGLIGVFVDNNDVQWVLGYDEKDAKLHPLNVTSGAGDSKKDLLEASEMIVTMVSVSREHPRVTTATIVTS